MERVERVEGVFRYNYYKYYQMNKRAANDRYLQKKQDDKFKEKYKKYYRDYWNLKLWEDYNLESYKKNKINNII